MEIANLLERIERDRTRRLSGPERQDLPQPDAGVTALLVAPAGDALLRRLADQAQVLGQLFEEFSSRALASKEPKAAAAALSAAVKAQQAGVRSLVAVAGLLAQRRGQAKVLVHDDVD